MRKNTTISLIIGIIISVIALYFAFRNVPLADLAVYLVSINYFWILPSVAVVLISFALRAFRWQIILESARKVSFWRAFHPLMIGFMINCILPGRIGEVARPAVLQKNEQVPFSTGLATVAVERVFDVGIMIVFFIALLATVQIDPNLDITFGKYHLNKETLITVGGAIFKLLIFLLAGMILVIIGRTRNVINGLIMGIPSLFFFAGSDFKEKTKKKFCASLVSFVENFASGLALVKYPTKMIACIGLSAVIWSLSALSYYLIAQGCPGIELSFNEMFAVMLIICLFIALPSVPGFWGIWEAGGVFALAIFGISSKEAAGFTLANHAIQMFPVIIAGLISAMLTSVNILQVSYEKKGIKV